MEEQGVISPVVDLKVQYKNQFTILKKVTVKHGWKNILDYVQLIVMRFIMKMES